MATEITHDEAVWLIDALVSVTTLCNKLEEKGMPELQAEADEVYDHIRDLAIALLEGIRWQSFGSVTMPAEHRWITTASDRNVVTC